MVIMLKNIKYKETQSQTEGAWLLALLWWLGGFFPENSPPSGYPPQGQEGSFVLGTWHLHMIRYDPSHSKADQKETRLQHTDKEITRNQVSRSQGLVQGGLATQVGLGAASWPVSCRPRPAPEFAGGNCLPVWVRPVQCSTIWALVSSCPSIAGGS